QPRADVLGGNRLVGPKKSRGAGAGGATCALQQIGRRALTDREARRRVVAAARGRRRRVAPAIRRRALAVLCGFTIVGQRGRDWRRHAVRRTARCRETGYRQQACEEGPTYYHSQLQNFRQAFADDTAGLATRPPRLS